MNVLLRIFLGIGRERRPEPIDLEGIAKREKELEARLARVRLQRKVMRRGRDQ